MDIKQKVKDLPYSPGVYLMKDKQGTIIYVGKAKKLKNRVSQYFQNNKQHTLKVKTMVSNIYDFEYILAPTELDALALESNLIKKYQPYYNILLKDGKSFPYIMVDIKSDYPKFTVVRKLNRKNVKYYGPFFGEINVWEIIKVIKSAFKIINCNYKFSETKPLKRECLNYSLGLCSAPCTNKISKEDYKKEIQKVCDFLDGNNKEIEEILKEKMIMASNLENFERAIELRDSIKIVEKLKNRVLTQLPASLDLDCFSFYTDEVVACISVLVLRNGKIIGVNNYNLNENFIDNTESLTSFIIEYYKNNIVPKNVYVSEELDFELLKEYYKKEESKTVNFYYPQKGIYKKLLDISLNNAKEYLQKNKSLEIRHQEKTIGAVCRLHNLLGLRNLPNRIETYDISNISGVYKVASMVVTLNGEQNKKHYRKFIIKTVEGSNDFASLQETLNRRFNEFISKDISFSSIPNLLVIDGGKGQLSSVIQIYEEFLCSIKDNKDFENIIEKIKNIDIISIAKKEEILYYNNKEFILNKDDKALNLIQNARDEAHRFAITFHRKLREKAFLTSQLDEIKGLGKVKKERILEKFNSFEKLKNATFDELISVKGIDNNLAKEIINKLS